MNQSEQNDPIARIIGVLPPDILGKIKAFQDSKQPVGVFVVSDRVIGELVASHVVADVVQLPDGVLQMLVFVPLRLVQQQEKGKGNGKTKHSP